MIKERVSRPQRPGECGGYKLKDKPFFFKAGHIKYGNRVTIR